MTMRFLLALSLVFGGALPMASEQGLRYSAPRTDGWEVLGPGGGGAQFNPTVSAVDPNLVLLNCDMTGAYISEDGGDSWRMFNLRGVVRFFVPDPVNRKIIYAATEALYRSKDTGKTWELLYPQPEDVKRVVISGDHAEERIVTRSGEHTVVEALAVDPKNSDALYAVISSDGRSKLHKSKDGGQTWEIVGDVSKVSKVYIDPESALNNRTVYLAGGHSVSVLQDGVIHQQKGPDGVKAFLDIQAGFPGRGKKPVFYAVSGMNWRGGDSGVTGAYVSVNGGADWQSIPTDFLSSAPKGSAKLELRAIGTSLHHPETAYLSFRDHTPGLPGEQLTMGVAKTVDMGKTWEMVWRDTEKTAGANVSDPWINQRFGPGWGENPFSLGVAPVSADICFGTDFGRTMRTKNGGKTWEGVYARRIPEGGSVTTGLDVLTVHGLHFDPFDLDHWLISFTDIGLFESRQGGHAWNEISSRGIPADWDNTAYWSVFDPAVKGRIWTVVSGTHDLPRPKMWRSAGVKTYQGGVVMSEDGGKSWKPSMDGMEQTAATHILLDVKSAVSARTLYVCGFGKGVFKSTDGGRHWMLKNTGIDGAEPFAWRLAQDSLGRLYLLVARRSDDGSIGTPKDGALYRSVDGAEHWQRLTLPAGCNAPNGLAIDPADPGRLYLAAWGRSLSSGDTGGGIFLSADGGQSWKNVLHKDQHVFDVTVDPKKPDVLYATGFESSVWMSVDRGESWARVNGYNFKWGQRVFPDPKNTGMIYVCTFGGAIWHGRADADTKGVADIVTPVLGFSH